MAGKRAWDEPEEVPKPHLPPGPASLEEVLRFLDAPLSSLESKVGKERFKGFLKNMASGMVITESYAGTGAMSTAAATLFDLVRERWPEHVSGGSPVVTYAATEMLGHAQMVLEKHKGMSRPLHRFENILGRISPVDLDTARRIEQEALSQFKAHEDAYKVGCISKADLFDFRAELGKELVEKLRHLMERIEFETTDYCLEHGMQCPITPRASTDPLHRSMMWVEGAGSTCCPFSRQNRSLQGKWLNTATLPLMVWLYSTRYYGPDKILHECVGGFDNDLLKQVFCNKQDDEGGDHGHCLDPIPTCPFTRVCPKCCDTLATVERKYQMNSQIFSPVNLGIPTGRRRRYTALDLIPVAAQDLEKEPGPTFESLFYRNMEVSCSIYMAASESQVKEFLSERVHATAQKLGYAPVGDTDYEKTLTCGEYTRLQGHRLNLCRQHKVLPKVALTCLDQNPEWMKSSFTKQTPTLLRKSTLYDMISQRPLLPLEYFLIQGYPHPDTGIISEELRAQFPFADALSILAPHEVTSLMGNGMHLAQAGTWLLWNMVPGLADASSDAAALDP